VVFGTGVGVGVARVSGTGGGARMLEFAVLAGFGCMVLCLVSVLLGEGEGK
jgi:hypothetical protein